MVTSHWMIVSIFDDEYGRLNVATNFTSQSPVEFKLSAFKRKDNVHVIFAAPATLEQYNIAKEIAENE